MNKLLHLVTALSFTPKSSWKPPKGNPSLKLFVSQIVKELFEVCKSNLGYSNIPKEEWQCMRSLANDRSIVIKKADKGSCVVAWDHEDYIAGASKQLNDESDYKSVRKKVMAFLKVKLLKNNYSILQLNIKKLPV